MGRRQGNNIFIAHDKRNEQMAYLLDNMTEPVFVNDDDDTASTIDNKAEKANRESSKNDEQLNKVGITYRLLNHQGFGRGRHEDLPSWGSVAEFMNSIQTYLPKSLQAKYTLWSRCSFRDNSIETIADDTKELLDEMVDWLTTMKQLIEDKLAADYFVAGRCNHLEILKRRYKLDWSERVESDVNANVKEDTTVNINFEDA